MKNKLNKIYIAYLKGCRKYVGHTNNLNIRKKEHYHKLGSTVTRKYRPHYIKVVGYCRGYRPCKYEEQKWANKLIKKYGYKCIRGGRYNNSKTF